jgi:hypothetical protein
VKIEMRDASDYLLSSDEIEAPTYSWGFSQHDSEIVKTLTPRPNTEQSTSGVESIDMPVCMLGLLRRISRLVPRTW